MLTLVLCFVLFCPLLVSLARSGTADMLRKQVSALLLCFLFAPPPPVFQVSTSAPFLSIAVSVSDFFKRPRASSDSFSATGLQVMKIQLEPK
mmetsp:Transcript_38050/g.98240  ORF Transcript_38050/g.98240 Transcript_38050/m.98240 type:complete len:92 (-) Transcript_38050:327-602(-)